MEIYLCAMECGFQEVLNTPGSHTNCSAYGELFIEASHDGKSLLLPYTNNMRVKNVENLVDVTSHVVPIHKKLE